MKTLTTAIAARESTVASLKAIATIILDLMATYCYS